MERRCAQAHILYNAAEPPPLFLNSFLQKEESQTPQKQGEKTACPSILNSVFKALFLIWLSSSIKKSIYNS